ncbi:Multidrug resistance protein 49 [Folsomia candida]|uniref:Multidrug resistance protein 49 n=1 Tax=Folsomia candida TaxID=158441 RepID=A0A226F438_FOLCA|nr:Multidrug resistance protein 49 [Folsomia candida]
MQGIGNNSKKKSKTEGGGSSSLGSGRNDAFQSRSLGATDIESRQCEGFTPELKEQEHKESEIILEPPEYIKHWKRQDFTGQTYGYFSLFRFSKPVDRLYFIFGAIAALISGFCTPILITTFGIMVRSMVLVSHIRSAISNNSISGNKKAYEDFLSQCKRDKPFGGVPLDFESLNSVVYSSIYEFTLWHGITSVIFTICSSLYFICWHIAGDNQIIRIRKQYFEALLRKDSTWFETQKDPDSVNKLMDHTKGIWVGIGENIPISINILTTAVICLIIAFCHGWQLTLLGLVALILIIFTNWLVSWTNSHKILAELITYKNANNVVEETLTNIRTVMFFGGQKKELLRYKRKLGMNSPMVIKWIFAHSGSVFLLWTINFTIWAVVFWFGLTLVIQQGPSCKDQSSYSVYDAGDVIIIIFCVIFGAGNVYMILPVVKAIKVASGYGCKVFKVIDRKSPIDGMDDVEGMQIMPDDFKGCIEFEDVRFTYPNSKGEPVKIDGNDIRDLNTKWLRKHIGVVPQHADFFDDSIESNIRMSNLDASFSEIMEACKCANAHTFIMSLKEGYQTKIGTNGYKLTMGQEQRLAIARMTNLDLQSGITVMDSIQRVAKERTVILVTHRLHMVTGADHIFVIKRGRVAEKGIHANLIKNQGPYHQLASGNVDKASISFREAVPFREFNTSEITAIHYMKMFASKSFLPNIYPDLMSVDPVAIQCTSLLMEHVVISHYAGPFRDRVQNLIALENEEDVQYTLELKDSIVTDDDSLSKSECMLRTNPDKPTLNKNADGQARGQRTDRYNQSQPYFWQVFWLTTNSTYKPQILISVLAACAIGLALPLFGVLLSQTIMIMSDTPVPHYRKLTRKFGDQNNYKWIVFGFVLLGVFVGVAASIQEFFLGIASYNMINRIRKKLFAAILQQDMSFFENPSIGVFFLRDMLASSVLTLRYVRKTASNKIGEMLIFGTITFGMNFSILPSFHLSIQAGQSILNVLNRTPMIAFNSGDEFEGDCKGELGFHEVHFWYPFSGENPLLKGVTFYIQPEKTVAFVGSSESGKTVYLDVIMKFFNVTSGVLTLDGKDLRDLNTVSLRQLIGYVDKQPQLFNRTVAENIAYGDNINNVPMSRVVEIAKQLGMHNFFCSLPDGYETIVGGEMTRLSTAQKHRIMIARAMLRNPKILLIDETTTYLDREGERLVNEAIDKARKGRTCILVSHRLAAVQNADLIVLMNDGFAIELGTHEDLMKRRHSEYGRLWRSQNPLDDESFAQGKPWLGVAPSKVKISPQKEEPPPPRPLPPPPNPQVALCFQLISSINGETQVIYSKIPLGNRNERNPSSQLSHFSPSPYYYFRNPTRQHTPIDDEEYFDNDSYDNSTEEEDASDQQNTGEVKEKMPEKKKSKVEQIQDIGEKLVDKWLDGFLQIETESPPDPPKWAMDIWGPPPSIQVAPWSNVADEQK